MNTTKTESPLADDIPWTPMDSAPKDGTEVLIQWNSADGIRESLAAWNGELWVSRELNWINGFPLICRRIMGWKTYEQL